MVYIAVIDCYLTKACTFGCLVANNGVTIAGYLTVDERKFFTTEEVLVFMQVYYITPARLTFELHILECNVTKQSCQTELLERDSRLALGAAAADVFVDAENGDLTLAGVAAPYAGTIGDPRWW